MEEETLTEPEPYKDDCFYLGSREMTGERIQGQGCLVEPIEAIWSLTQEDKPKRKNSHKSRTSSTSSTGSTPSNEQTMGKNVKFVEIVVGPRDINVRDCNSRDTLIEFSIKRVATCGIHRKIPQAFAFVAVQDSLSPAFCHVFKCNDKEAASELAKRSNEWFSYYARKQQKKQSNSS